jgi:hypothetical protein
MERRLGSLDWLDIIIVAISLVFFSIPLICIIDGWAGKAGTMA